MTRTHTIRTMAKLFHFRVYYINSLNSQDIINVIHIIGVIIKSFQQSDSSSGSSAPGDLYETKMAAFSRFANVSDEEIAELNISAVPKST